MVTVVGMWEPGFNAYEQVIEYRIWKQTIGAYDVDRWIMVGVPPNEGITSYESFATLEEALATCENVVCFQPNGEVEAGAPLPFDNPTLVFGNIDENLAGLSVLNLTFTTPKPVDMFACAVLPMVLDIYGSD